MKLGTIQIDGRVRVACLLNEHGGTLVPAYYGDLVDIIAGGQTILEMVRSSALVGEAEQFNLTDVKVLAPIQRFSRDVLCTGWNYWDHFYESEGKREGQDVPKPDAPTFFTKAPTVTISPDDDVALDARLSQKWDYEAEIVVVIGKTGRSIPKERAHEHIFGYCLANDISQRDLQRRHGGQWFRGKSLDATMPLGPWITLRDDIAINDVGIEFELNGKLMQKAKVSDMAFPIEELIAELSLGLTLYAGDILLTGTPSGIGNARTPPVFLKAGDRIVTRANGLGELRNTLRATDLSTYTA
ncbi:fumarylacetoacetate hydrolase family protein [Pseudomonas sp. P9_2]|uniref:fumarylacetoacetate hydrolase family protein n=1 Tax=Pseudomonas sp. P9_2 TaxID=3043447 RepID=UPI002A36683F|nr:fumarylacetoacetate hydrolase family protein [Pseudomonas sp. P9_2]WPN52030.1 fumarylacetoacetate hydrolase family protein [Pseudomonas sp. P9_2]